MCVESGKLVLSASEGKKDGLADGGTPPSYLISKSLYNYEVLRKYINHNFVQNFPEKTKNNVGSSASRWSL
jgi:hypothetical protein